jgi:hypothetical protein
MKSKGIATICFSVLIWGLMFSFAYAQDIVEKKTLTRQMDNVVMKGDLARDLIGKPIANIRLYSCNNGILEPIRYQIDEMTQDGDLVLPEGPKPNKELGNGIFNERDLLLFMVRDTGDRASKEFWPEGCTSGEEIEIIDPLNGKKGWAYLLYFASNPPARSAKQDYSHFYYDKNYEICESRKTECLTTKDGKRTIFVESQYVPKEAGGSGKNYVDILKFRITIKALMNKITIRLNESMYSSDLLAIKNGPIRSIKRSEQYKDMPFGMKGARVVCDVIAYRETATTPMMVKIPFQFSKLGASCVIRSGTDYTEETFGGIVYNSNNLQGCRIDGKMDDCEKNWNPKQDLWRVAAGDFGALLAANIYPSEWEKNTKITTGITDDITYKDAPERFPGCIGYLWTDSDITHLPKGNYQTIIDTCVPINFKKGDEINYANYLYHPIMIRVGDRESKNNHHIFPKIGKKYM